MTDVIVHYGGNGYAECGEQRVETTKDVHAVSCRTCRGWLPIVAPTDDCCERADQYNGYGSDGPLLFECPAHCACHD